MFRNALFLVVILGAFALVQYVRSQDEIPTQAYQEIEQARDFDSLKEYLDTKDPQQARLVLMKLAGLSDSRAQSLFLDLWVGGTVRESMDNKATYDDPIAKLSIAEYLLDREPSDAYSGYIKNQASNNDWIVQSITAEALAVVDDDESVMLLAKLSRSNNYFVARTAVESFVKMARRGIMYQSALDEIVALRDDPSIKNSRLKEDIERAYSELAYTQKSYSSAAIISPGSNYDLGVASDDGMFDSSMDREVQPYLIKGQYDKAINVLLPEASQGNIKAQHLLGELYLAIEIPNHDEAAKWYKVAAQNNYAPAKSSLAQLYLDGRGVEKNTEIAVELLQEAELQGDEYAKSLLEKARLKGWWGL